MANKMNVFLAFRKYMTRMLTSDMKMKILLLDEETVSMISLVYSYAEILDKEVFGTEMLFLRKNRKKLDYMDAVIFIRPTEKNLYYLKEELKEPSYKNYRIYFSKSLPPGYLQKVAAHDKFAKVEQVFEFYADFAALGPNLFTTNFSETAKRRTDAPPQERLAPSIPESYYNPFSKEYQNRTVDGILSVLLSLKKKPTIRYSNNGRNLAMNIAMDISKRMRDTKEAAFKFEQGRRETQLLILDRHDDPLTPLLIQMTYQSMVHDMSSKGIKFNVATLIVPDESSNDPEAKKKKKITMSEMTDMTFFGTQMYNTYIQLTKAARMALTDYKNMKNQVANLKKQNKLEDMQKLLSKIPLLNSKKAVAEKHLKMIEHLTTQMEKEQSSEVVKVQQDIAAKDNNASESANTSALKQSVQSKKIKPLDKLKLAMLFALRYEEKKGNAKKLDKIVGMLKGSERGLSAESIQLLETLIEHMGVNKRRGDCFTKRGKLTALWAAGKNTAQLVNTTPLMVDLVRKVCNNELDKTQFPYLREHEGTNVPDDIIIFIVGGATYAEAKAVHEINTNSVWGKPSKEFKNKQVILGAPHIFRSITFLKYLKQLKDLNSSSNINRPHANRTH